MSDYNLEELTKGYRKLVEAKEHIETAFNEFVSKYPTTKHDKRLLSVFNDVFASIELFHKFLESKETE